MVISLMVGSDENCEVNGVDEDYTEVTANSHTGNNTSIIWFAHSGNFDFDKIKFSS